MTGVAIIVEPSRSRRRRCSSFFTLPCFLSLLLVQISLDGHITTAAAATTSDNATDKINTTSTRPRQILEAEARTARELSQAVQSLQRSLQTCTSRVEAIQAGFQNLYAAHLANVDGLRKCKEGVLGKKELEELENQSAFVGKLSGDNDVDGTFAALLAEAQAKQDSITRRSRDEALHSKHKEVISSLETQVLQLRLREKAWERTISELVARRDLLERREGAWERTIGELMAEVEVRAKREGWYEGVKVEMEGRIGMLSRISVLERFGPGPHYVSMVVDLGEDESSTKTNHREIIFQLAPLHLMPHSIHLFLTQIAEGYWSRGAPAIVINPGHVLQACPHPCLESVSYSGDNPYTEMKNAGVDSVSFQEYDPRYPHEKYTIGFAGRPHSGPEFYINLLNNTLDHGPFEQRKRELGPDYLKEVFGQGVVDEKVLEPDPCFGKVIEGFDVVDRIAEERITRASLPEDAKEMNEAVDESFDNTLLVRPVPIVSMTILESYPKKTREGGGGKEEL